MAKKMTNKKKFNKTNLKNVPNQSGVYQINNSQGKPIYVGMAGAGRLPDRLGEHLTEKDIRGANTFQFISTTSQREAQSLEKKLIKQKSPKQNIQHNS